MQASTKRVMHYHGDASPIAGYITHPIEAVLSNNASCALGSAGGHASAHHHNFKVDTLIHVGKAYSQATGTVHKDTGNWTTLVTAVVEDVNILEIVTADRIVAVLSIEHPLVGDHPKASFVGSHFDNLKIDGRSVNVPIHPRILATHPADAHVPPEEADFPALPWTQMDHFVGTAVAQSQLATAHPSAPGWFKERYKWMESPEERQRKGYIHCSLAQKIEGTPVDQTFGHVLHVPDLGNIFLAELAVDHRAFRLTMMRIEMGCRAEGTMSFSTGGGNGSGSP